MLDTVLGELGIPSHRGEEDVFQLMPGEIMSVVQSFLLPFLLPLSRCLGVGIEVGVVIYHRHVGVVMVVIVIVLPKGPRIVQS